MPGMNAEEIVVVSRGGGRLQVRLTAIVKTKDSSRLYADIRQLALAHKAMEVLIDASAVQEKLSVLKRLHMIMAFVTHLREFRVAGVVSEYTVDPKRLGETMARNRGA